MLRAVRRAPRDGKLISVSAADPLNVPGILLPGPRLPAISKNRILLGDGVPAAVREAARCGFWRPWSYRSAPLSSGRAYLGITA